MQNKIILIIDNLHELLLLQYSHFDNLYNLLHILVHHELLFLVGIPIFQDFQICQLIA
jgi:hypothetical protein